MARFRGCDRQEGQAVKCAEPVPKTADSIATFDRLTNRDIASGPRFMPTNLSNRK
jgi:hypothetical protein